MRWMILAVLAAFMVAGCQQAAETKKADAGPAASKENPSGATASANPNELSVNPNGTTNQVGSATKK
ncbi:MAG: hypothetical protein JSS66_01530 [Armatimonadetes bacterium]|nr:hypothetical protein [Armatimonadota bacterium]